MSITSRIQKYTDHHDPSEASRTGYDIVQQKFDGWWCRCEVKDGAAHLYSRTGSLIAERVCQRGLRGTFIGELMVGTNRSRKSVNQGRFIAFDCVSIDGVDIAESMIYTDRHAACRRLTEAASWALLVETKPFSEAATLWESADDIEGLVYRRSRDLYREARMGRSKRRLSRDFIVMDIEPGRGKHDGRAGAIVCGLIGSSGLTEVCRVGTGFRDAERAEMLRKPEDYIGRVAEVLGHGEYDGGALRHPTFSRWREDKLPSECVFGRVPA